jgi:hypothetical protein
MADAFHSHIYDASDDGTICWMNLFSLATFMDKIVADYSAIGLGWVALKTMFPVSSSPLASSV